MKLDDDSLLIRCDCQSEIISFDYICWDDNEQQLDITLYSFYPEKTQTFFQKLQLIWNIMRGKKQRYGEIVCGKDQMRKLRDFMNELFTNEKDS